MIYLRKPRITTFSEQVCAMLCIIAMCLAFAPLVFGLSSHIVHIIKVNKFELDLILNQ